MSDQKTEQKPDHEKRIREALDAGPTEGPWFEHHDKGHLYIENQRDDVVCDMGLRAKSTPTSQFIAACNPIAIRAIFADLDAMREKAARYDYLSERFVGADFDWNESGTQVLVFEVEPGTQVWATADETIDGAIAALKGASA